MGCLKLTYYPQMRIVRGREPEPSREEKSVQWWLLPDPLAEKYYSISPYAYCGNNPIRFIDLDGRDWIEAKGSIVYWYGGNLGNRSQLLHTYPAVSGAKGYQSPQFQHGKDYGPTVEGYYSINLEPDPDRQATAFKDPETGGAKLLRNDDGGIEKVGDKVPVYDNNGKRYGITDASQLWGNRRAKLDPVNVQQPKGGSRDLSSFYFHDSQKGQTSGCIEVPNAFFSDLLHFMKDNPDIKKIDVWVNYKKKEEDEKKDERR